MQRRQYSIIAEPVYCLPWIFPYWCRFVVVDESRKKTGRKPHDSKHGCFIEWKIERYLNKLTETEQSGHILDCAGDEVQKLLLSGGVSATSRPEVGNAQGVASASYRCG